VFHSLIRRKLLVARANRRGDVLAGEFVQCLWGGPVGFLKSVQSNGVGLVWWIRQPGRYEIIDTKLLKRAEEPKVKSS
jgi:hypothetical protein